ncbi:hypothetical protein B0T24DRAFT_261083 [Lasiosphaeria ovina]|uniref:Uncharacterized protein n=1 Tax=Lasiosphaeria ovina TaxID=92902 RepID=A0AAE0KB13_9PEZI|nr:hypothetical protein B0T24DRAFT_261083 [Lasiosphaeria ovina]
MLPLAQARATAAAPHPLDRPPAAPFLGPLGGAFGARSPALSTSLTGIAAWTLAPPPPHHPCPLDRLARWPTPTFSQVRRTKLHAVPLGLSWSRRFLLFESRPVEWTGGLRLWHPQKHQTMPNKAVPVAGPLLPSLRLLADCIVRISLHVHQDEP